MNKFCIVMLLKICSMAAHPQFSLELNAGTKRVSAQLRVFKYIDKSNRWSLYSSNGTVVKYDTWKPGFLSGNILAYNFRSGIGLGAILIATESGLHTSAGLQYQKTIKSFYLYFLSTHELNKLARQENYFVLMYKPKLSNRVKFVFHNENYICFRKWGHDQSLQRIKIGLEISQTQVGFLSEISQTRKSYESTVVNLGCYIKKSF